MAVTRSRKIPATIVTGFLGAGKTSMIRHLLTKHGGSMAESGAVVWNFDPKGHITMPRNGLSEEDLFEKAIEAGAEDVVPDSDPVEITTAPQDLHAVAEVLQQAGVEIETLKLTMFPKTTVKVEGKDAAAVLRLMEALDDHDDVQDVYANFDISDEEMAAAVGE